MRTEFDYIIVGAGTAGCVLANRLSGDTGNSVLVLEAGPKDRTPFIHIPLGLGLLFDHKKLNWRLKSAPELSINNRVIGQPLGKVLGGTSSINGMMYIRGQREDYDQWAAQGNRGWSYEEVLPYFKRSECYEGGADTYHGHSGQWHVEEVRYQPALLKKYKEAALAMGIPSNNDVNGAHQQGVCISPVSQKRGRRDSTATAFLNPIKRRPNLTLLTESHVKKILFEKQRATWIRYERRGKTFETRVRKEMLLCSGALNSPKLLQLSGVGPKRLLEEYDIKLVCDLPGVGENLQEHLGVDVVYECTQPLTLMDELKPHRFLKHLLMYLFKRQGLLTFNGPLITAFCHTSGDHLQRPDCQLVFFPVYPLTRETHGSKINPTQSKRGMTSMGYPLKPDARGSVRIQSGDPFQAPKIYHNFLETQRDRGKLIEAVRLQRKLFAQGAFDACRGEEILPGASVRSDEEILEYIRATASGCYHPVGTCKMGQDEMAVVDDQLRVRGLKGLRVVDGSVMPVITSGNTCAPIVMIAEKASEMILQK